MSVFVIRPGIFTTVQDAGRFGWQSLGIGPGGVMDLDAMRMANILVGNDESAAVLESTLVGPVLRFEHDSIFALFGAPVDARIDDEPIPNRHLIVASAGTELDLGPCTAGSRTTLAIAGGVDVAPVLGSRSSNVRAHFGGFEGRAIRAGDRLPLGPLSVEARGLLAAVRRGRRWAADTHGFGHDLTPPIASNVSVRTIPTALFLRLDKRSQEAFVSQPFRVGQQSDRMGYRLEGDTLTLLERREMITEAVAWGAVQLPPDGQPIVLLADRPTTGGYPVIGHVASVDRSVMAQLRPGDDLRFVSVSLAEAEEAYATHERRLAIATDALQHQRARIRHDAR